MHPILLPLLGKQVLELSRPLVVKESTPTVMCKGYEWMTYPNRFMPTTRDY